MVTSLTLNQLLYVRLVALEHMDFDEYQKEALKTAVYPNIGDRLAQVALGLTGEAGEVADKVKKLFRDKDGVLDKDAKLALAQEAGDTLWYIAIMAEELGLTLKDIAKMNIEKLRDRKKRGVIHGDGDDR